jgi:hypothetical protein
MGRTQDRTWRIHPDPDTGVVDPGEVIGALQEAAVILLRVGGGVTVVPERFAHPRTGEWLTHAVNVKWTSFVPPIQPPAPWFVHGDEPYQTAEGSEAPVLPGIDEEALATLEGQEPFDASDADEDAAEDLEADEEPALSLE